MMLAAYKAKRLSQGVFKGESAMMAIMLPNMEGVHNVTQWSKMDLVPPLIFLGSSKPWFLCSISRHVNFPEVLLFMAKLRKFTTGCKIFLTI